MIKIYFLAILLILSSCLNQNKKNVSSIKKTKLDTLNVDLDLFFNYKTGTSNLSNDYNPLNHTPNLYRLKLNYYNGLKSKIKSLSVSLLPTSNLINVSKINDSTFDFSISNNFTDTSMYFTIFLKPKKGYLIHFTPTKEFISSKDSLEGCQIGNLAPKFKFVN